MSKTRVFNESNWTVIVGANDGKYYRLPSACDSPPTASPTEIRCGYVDESGNRKHYVWKLVEGRVVHIVDRLTTPHRGLPPVEVRGLGVASGGHAEGPLPNEVSASWLAREHETWVNVLGAGITGLSVAHE